MEIGIIRWYGNGFGEVVISSDKRVFFHKRKNPLLAHIFPGDAVIFYEVYDDSRERAEASNMRKIQKDDWPVIMKNLVVEDNVEIKIGRRTERLSIKETALRKLLQHLNPEEFQKIAEEYFQKSVAESEFVKYCDFLNKVVTAKFTAELAKEYLKPLWDRFGALQSEEIIFQIWKSRKFSYVGLKDDYDYEIPESIIYSRKRSLCSSEIVRISDYKYGVKFIRTRIQELLDTTHISFQDIQPFLAPNVYSLNAEILAPLMLELPSLHNEYIKKMLCDYKIAKETTFNLVILQLNALIPSAIDEVIKNSLIKNNVAELISKCCPSLVAELFLKGIIHDPPIDKIIEYFGSTFFYDPEFKILAKYSLDKQSEFVKQYYLKYGLKAAYRLVFDFHKQKSGYQYISISRSNHYQYSDYDTSNDDLVHLWEQFILPQLSDNEKVELFKEGFIKTLPLTLYYSNIKEFNKEQWKGLCLHLRDQQQLLFTLFVGKISVISQDEILWLTEYANEYLQDDFLRQFNLQLLDQCEDSIYLKLWSNKLVQIKREKYSKEQAIEHFRIRSIYHMTHKSNMANIIEYGLLSHLKAHEGKNLVDISDHMVNERRSKKDPVFGKPIHSYVPLYFNPKNPMLYKRKTEQDDIIILEINTSELLRDGILFTDGNAASSGTKFFNSLLDLRELDWVCINGAYWRDQDDGKRIRCAEALIPERIDVSRITGIYTNTEITLRYVESLLPPNSKISSELCEDFYFNEREYYYL